MTARPVTIEPLFVTNIISSVEPVAMGRSSAGRTVSMAIVVELLYAAENAFSAVSVIFLPDRAQ